MRVVGSAMKYCDTMLITLFLFIFCLIAVCRKCDGPLNRKRPLTDLAKFIAALLVVNGHLMIFGGAPDALATELNLGTLCVSLFLFFSGYGLMTSYAAKGQAYFHKFIRHRIGRVVLPLLTAYLVTLPVYRIFAGPIDWMKVLETVGWGGPYLRFSWYVTEIIGLYLLFYLTMRPTFLAVNVKVTILSVCIAIVMGTLAVLQQPLWYIVSLPAFVIGIWFQRYEELILRTTKGFRIVSTLLLSAALLVTFRWDFIAQRVEALSMYRYQYVSYYSVNVVFILLAIILLIGISPPLG